MLPFEEQLGAVVTTPLISKWENVVLFGVLEDKGRPYSVPFGIRMPSASTVCLGGD